MISEREQVHLGSSPGLGTHGFGIWQGQHGIIEVLDRPKLLVLWARENNKRQEEVGIS